MVTAAASDQVAPRHRVTAQGGVEGRMSGQGAPSLQRYPSTADTAPPTPGAWCSSCFGTRWWTERHQPKGWRCVRCHPPAHLSAEAIRREGEG